MVLALICVFACVTMTRKGQYLPQSANVVTENIPKLLVGQIGMTYIVGKHVMKTVS